MRLHQAQMGSNSCNFLTCSSAFARRAETRLNSSSAMTWRDRVCSVFCCAAESWRG